MTAQEGGSAIVFAVLRPGQGEAFGEARACIGRTGGIGLDHAEGAGDTVEDEVELRGGEATQRDGVGEAIDAHVGAGGQRDGGERCLRAVGGDASDRDPAIRGRVEGQRQAVERAGIDERQGQGGDAVGVGEDQAPGGDVVVDQVRDRDQPVAVIELDDE